MATALPFIMVAPNGARRTKADHPALPVTIAETVTTARACYDAGAGGLHAHVRDGAQRHVLDAGLYRELIDEMARAVPDMVVQITTEAVGLYSPDEQMRLVRDVEPDCVSIAVREILADGDTPAVEHFFAWLAETDIAVQMISYDPGDVDRFLDLAERGWIAAGSLQAMLVLGRYTDRQIGAPHDLDPMLDKITNHHQPVDWAVCAFGQPETDCLVYAAALGGKLRVGFENNLVNKDGRVATDNAERVAEIARAVGTGDPT